jgi:hypothetical protein
MQIIHCAFCDDPCGKEYPDTGPTYSSGGEQGFREGIGENFILNDEWYCSQMCLDAAIKLGKEGA